MLPFISIFLVKNFQINIIYTFITCAVSFILCYLIYSSKESKLTEMKEVLNLDSPPSIDLTCEKCAYLKGGKNYF